MTEPQQLIERYFAGECSPQDFAALRAWLDENPEHMDRFLRRAAVERFLGELEAGQASASALQTPRDRRLRIAAWKPALAAAVALIVVTVWWLGSNTASEQGPGRAPTVAMLTDIQQAVFADADEPMHIGDPLAVGRLELLSGRAQVMFESGAVVDLAGPCAFELTGANRGQLMTGRLESYVPRQAQGFTIDLPGGARVVDLGTRYQLEVLPGGRSQVWVIAGSVEVATSNQSRLLGEGASVVMSEGRLIETPGLGGDDIVRFTPERIGSQQIGVKQDGQYGLPASVTIFDGGRTLRLAGNAWKTLEHPYTVTEHTILEAEFRTTRPGEIHAIGFDARVASGASAWRYGVFQIFGSESVSIVSREYLVDEADQWVRVRIPVGRHYTGRFERLLFVCDDDANGAADSWFRNVRLYEKNNDKP